MQNTRVHQPDHERLRRELESAAEEARSQAGERRVITGRQAVIGVLAAVPIAAAVIAAVAAARTEPQPATPAAPDGPSAAEPAVPSPAEPSPAEPSPAVPSPAEPAAPPPPSPRPAAPRAPAASSGPDVPPRAEPARPGPGRPAPAPDVDRPTTHTVQPGETLARIALRYQVPIEQIAEQNAIADPDVIRAGDTLQIRPAPANEIVIPQGATLTGLASRLGVTVSHLLRLNPHIIDEDKIVAGGRLRIA